MTRRTFHNNCNPSKSSSAARKQKSKTVCPFRSCTRNVPYEAMKQPRRKTNREGECQNGWGSDLEDEVLAQEGICLRREARRPRPGRRGRGRFHGAAAVLGFPLLFLSLSVDFNGEGGKGSNYDWPLRSEEGNL